MQACLQGLSTKLFFRASYQACQQSCSPGLPTGLATRLPALEGRGTEATASIGYPADKPAQQGYPVFSPDNLALALPNWL